MKLHWSPLSPFVRKVMILAHERGLVDRIVCVRTRVTMTETNADLLPDNPLGKIPTLVLDDGTSIYDSSVICEYLQGLVDDRPLARARAADHIVALRREALGDGLLDVLLLWRNELMRPAAQRSTPHLDAWRVKVEAALAALDREARLLADSAFGIGHIAIGCALSYIDFRFPQLPWRDQCPQLAAWHATFEARPSVRATRPPAAADALRAAN